MSTIIHHLCWQSKHSYCLPIVEDANPNISTSTDRFITPMRCVLYPLHAGHCGCWADSIASLRSRAIFFCSALREATPFLIARFIDFNRCLSPLKAARSVYLIARIKPIIVAIIPVMHVNIRMMDVTPTSANTRLVILAITPRAATTKHTLDII